MGYQNSSWDLCDLTKKVLGQNKKPKKEESLKTKISSLTLFFLGGGGKFTLSALYRIKSPESMHEVGVMGYQNSSWDICDLTKKVSGPKNF